MSESKHARLSPSGAHRWMTCAGSVALEDGLPDNGNEYSEEGTCAHGVAAMCLIEGRPATAYIGRRITVAPFKTREFTAEMAEPVQTYVDSVTAYASIPSDDDRGRMVHELHVEQALPIGHITGEEGAEGTGDAVIITEDQEEIQVHDLKFGRGVAVSAERNPQLMLYALGALRKFDLLGTFKRVRVVIHQPRIQDAPSEWDCTVDELLAFSAEASKLAKHAMTAYEFRANWLGKDNSYLQPSNDACKFCKAKATCPALAAKVQETVGADFDVLVTNTAVAPMHYLDGGNLSTKLKAVDVIEDWCKAIRAEVERRLLAGEQVPDFKIVRGRMGNRSWKDETEAENLLKSFRLKQEQMYSFKLISPTAAEKVLKENPKRWSKAQELITRSDGALSVAPLTDKRPAVECKPVVDDFETITGAEDLV